MSEPSNVPSTAAVACSALLGRCVTCKWWLEEEDRYNSIVNPPDPVTYDQCETEEEIRAKWGHTVRHCKHPKILFYQRPEIDAAAVMDGSEYMARLLTSEQFGCVLHERPNDRTELPPPDTTVATKKNVQ